MIDRPSPILLIAPHGGRAEAAFRGPNPKVNDLHTVEITRTLADRLAASALINFAMDRNRLDCNRLGQLVERAPWLLEMIARRVEEIVARHGRAIVLLIHGWNIIEPRVDFGLGARLRDGRLVPAGRGHISAGDEFINRTVTAIARAAARQRNRARFRLSLSGRRLSQSSPGVHSPPSRKPASGPAAAGRDRGYRRDRRRATGAFGRGADAGLDAQSRTRRDQRGFPDRRPPRPDDGAPPNQ